MKKQELENQEAMRPEAAKFKKEELEMLETSRWVATELKKQKLELELRKFAFFEQKKREKDIIFFNSPIDPSLPLIQQQKLQEINDTIKASYELDY